MAEDGFTHLDERGNARMVDVGDKPVTRRVAEAEGRIRTRPETARAIAEGGSRKGNVLAVAQIAGVIGAKRTSDLIPLCHPLPLEAVRVELAVDPDLPGVTARAVVEVEAKTGVEMEALTAVSAALLTVYDMCKGVDRGMVIEEVRLLRKEGGRTGRWTRDPEGR